MAHFRTVVYQKPNGPKETRTEFFVRVSNGTKPLNAVEREKYILQRLGEQLEELRLADLSTSISATRRC